MHKVQFFRQFNIAWFFCWKYILHQFFQDFFPLSLVRIYETKWWNEFKVKLRGQENVEHFCKIKTKKFTLHKLHLFEKKASIKPSTLVKKEGSSSLSKSKTNGLSQKERELLEYLKDDPSIRQIVHQKILDKQGDSDDETISSAASLSPHQQKPRDPYYQHSQDPYDL